MLETLREFALETLSLADEQEWRGRHEAYFRALAERAESALRGPEQGAWLAALEAEHDNLRAALDWALQTEQTEMALRLAGALGRFWHTRGYLREGLEWLQRGLGAVRRASCGARRARAASAAGRSGEGMERVWSSLLVAGRLPESRRGAREGAGAAARGEGCRRHGGIALPLWELPGIARMTSLRRRHT